MEISGIIVVICLGGSLALILAGGLLLIPIEQQLHSGNSKHH